MQLLLPEFNNATEGIGFEAQVGNQKNNFGNSSRHEKAVKQIIAVRFLKQDGAVSTLRYFFRPGFHPAV